MLVKTITAKVYQPTARKRKALKGLWRSWKDALGSKRDYAFLRESTDLPSFYCREMSWKIKKGADAPVGVPKDALKLLPGGAFAPWFASIPTPDGRVRLPLRMSRGHSELLAECEICDSQLIKHGKEYHLHIVVSKDAPIPTIPIHAPVLAVDIGERVIATSVMLVEGTITHIADPAQRQYMGENEAGIESNDGGDVGFYTWVRSADVDGTSSQVKTQVTNDAEGTTLQFNYDQGDYIIHDPKLGVPMLDEGLFEVMERLMPYLAALGAGAIVIGVTVFWRKRQD